MSVPLFDHLVTDNSHRGQEFERSCAPTQIDPPQPTREEAPGASLVKPPLPPDLGPSLPQSLPESQISKSARHRRGVRGGRG